jgi:FkbM family methyltransferase
MNNIQGWTVIENDKTLLRAMKNNGLEQVEDYQKEQIDLALTYCKNFRSAIDIGAHYGIMSFHMSQRFDEVHSFEIQPDVYNCLEQNMKNFRCNNVKLHPFGVGEENKTVHINFNEGSTFQTHIDPNGVGIEVEIKKLDKFKIKDVDFIKIDAEGYEPFILQGGLKTILKNKPVILYEAKLYPETRYGVPRDNFLNILSQHGYTVLDYVGSKNKLIGVI